MKIATAVVVVKARWGGKGGRGGGKGGKAEGKGAPNIPEGAKQQTADGKRICYNFNCAAGCSRGTCSFTHVCWFCEKDAHGGHNCTDH